MQNASPVAVAKIHKNGARLPQVRKLAWAVAAVCAMGCGSVMAQAMPSGANVTHGSANVTTPNANTMQVNVGTNKAVIDWNSFSIGNGNLVQFVQPGASAVTLNRVIGGTSSNIAGNLTANGQIFLVNTNGVFFSATASVNVGGLIATTLDISNTDFLADTYTFAKAAGSGLGQVTNNGSITAADGGYVGLFGERVHNGPTGVITAPNGKIALGAGERVNVLLDNNQLLTFNIDQRALDSSALVSNAGQLLADGGSVQMSASVANALTAAVVNQSGVIRAAGVSQRNGEVYLSADGGDVEVSGSIEVGALSGAPRASLRIDATGGNINLQNSAQLASSGAAGSNVYLSSTGQINLGGSIQSTSSEGSASITARGEGVAFGDAQVIANGFMMATVTGNAGSNAILQNAGGLVRAATTATASEAAGQGGYAYASVSLDGQGAHNLAGSVQAAATGPDSAALASIISGSSSIVVGSISARAEQGGAAGNITLTAPGSVTIGGDLYGKADNGSAQIAVNGNSGVGMSGDVTAIGKSALVDVRAGGTDIALDAGKTVLATSTTAGGGGALVYVSTPNGTTHIDGSLQTQAPGGNPSHVVVDLGIVPVIPQPTLAIDLGQSLLSRLSMLIQSRSTPSNPLGRNGLIVMPSWDIVGASLNTGSSIDAALLEEDGPDNLAPTSDIQVDAAPVNAAMKK